MSRFLLALCLIAYAAPGLAQTGSWQADENQPDQRRIAAIAPAADGSVVTLPLDLPGSGYVVLHLPADRSDITAALYDGAGIRRGQNAARIGLPDGARADIILPAGAEPLALDIRFWPEIDTTEPNDDALLGWPVELRTRQQAVLFPANDQDYFSFTLEQDRTVRIHLFETAEGVETGFVNAETGEDIAAGPSADLPAGRYAVRISGGNDREPQYVGFSLAPELVIPATGPDGSVLPLAIGQPQLVPTGTDTARFAFTVEQAGRYEFRTDGLGANTAFEITNAAGESVSERAAHLSEGVYTLTLSQLEPGDEPGFVSGYRSAMEDRAEPNDFPTDATPVEIDEPVGFMLEANSPPDWFRLTAPGNGRIEPFMETGPHNCDYFWLERVHSDPGVENVNLGPSRIVSPLNFLPFDVSEGESILLSLICTNRAGEAAEAELLLRFVPEGMEAASVESESSVYLVGLELYDITAASLAEAARNAGVNFVQAEEVESLDARIQEISRSETRAGFPWWIVILLILLAGGGGFAVYRMRRRAEPDPE